MSYLVRVSEELHEKMQKEKPKGMTQPMYFDFLFEQQKRIQKIQKNSEEILEILNERDGKIFEKGTSDFLDQLNKN